MEAVLTVFAEAQTRTKKSGYIAHRRRRLETHGRTSPSCAAVRLSRTYVSVAFAVVASTSKKGNRGIGARYLCIRIEACEMVCGAGWPVQAQIPPAPHAHVWRKRA
jgi:hypothetical protein